MTWRVHLLLAFCNAQRLLTRAVAFTNRAKRCNKRVTLASRFLSAQDIAKFKLPERLEILSDFPISAAGKIMRRTLRDMIEVKLRTEMSV